MDSWQTQLNLELKGLEECKAQVTSDLSIPAPVKTRFKRLLQRLNESIAEIMRKTTWLQREDLSDSEYTHEALRLKQEYRTIMHNIAQIVNTFSLSAVKPTQITEFTENSELKSLNFGLKSLEKLTEETKNSLETHKHGKITDQIREIRRENDQLALKLHAIESEQAQFIEIAEDLKRRIADLERNGGVSRQLPAQQRVLTKRLGEAERLLRG